MRVDPLFCAGGLGSPAYYANVAQSDREGLRNSRVKAARLVVRSKPQMKAYFSSDDQRQILMMEMQRFAGRLCWRSKEVGWALAHSTSLPAVHLWTAASNAALAASSPKIYY